jgi:triosephosphate isomerase
LRLANTYAGSGAGTSIQGGQVSISSDANVNGALVGGASLVASDFLAIAAAYRD